MPVRVIIAVLRTAVVIVLALVHIVLAHVVGFLCVSGCKVYMHLVAHGNSVLFHHYKI